MAELFGLWVIFGMPLLLFIWGIVFAVHVGNNVIRIKKNMDKITKT